jgi:hypothetical protein
MGSTILSGDTQRWTSSAQPSSKNWRRLSKCLSTFSRQVHGAQRCLPSPEIKHTVNRAEQWIQLVCAEQNGDPEFSLERLRELDHVELVARVLSKKRLRSLSAPDLSCAPGEGPIKSELRLNYIAALTQCPTL